MSEATQVPWASQIPEGFAQPTGEVVAERHSDELPKPNVLQQALDETVFDKKGQSVAFGKVLSSQSNIVIFIRHFRCGMCQDFLAYLNMHAKMRPEVLSQAGVKLSIIGCGDWEMIEGYKKILSLECDVYANPSGSLYQILGMRQSSKVKTDIRNFYIQGGFLSMVARSVKNALAMGNVTKNGGEVSQLGGEFVFTKDGAQCLFAHIMKDQADHADVDKILSPLGADFMGVV